MTTLFSDGNVDRHEAASRTSRRRFAPMQLVPTYGLTFGDLDATSTLMSLWHEHPEFQYTEADDWRLAGSELREAVHGILVKHPELLVDVVTGLLDDEDIPAEERLEIATQILDILQNRRIKVGINSRSVG